MGTLYRDINFWGLIMKTNLLAATLVSVLALGAPIAFAAHHESTHEEGMYEGDDHATHYAEHHADDIAAAINAEDRAADERERDAVRHPDVTLTFSQIEPGSRVMDIGAGGGYYTMLVSGLVGPEGHVTGQNPQLWADNYGANWPEVQGAKMEARGNIDFVVAEFDDLGVEPGSLDAITFMLTYHDSALLPIDRAVMNQGFFDALRPGGLLMISDHSGPGATTAEAIDAVHRIDADMVREEVEAAGFELIATSDAMANPDDDHTLNVFNPAIRGQTDRFVYLFRKPE